MYEFFVRRDEKKVAIVQRWPLEEVRLYVLKMRVVRSCYIQSQLNSRPL